MTSFPLYLNSNNIVKGNPNILESGKFAMEGYKYNFNTNNVLLEEQAAQKNANLAQ